MSSLTFLQPIRVHGNRPHTPQQLVAEILAPIIKRVTLFTGYTYADLKNQNQREPDLRSVRTALIYVIACTGTTYGAIGNALNMPMETVFSINKRAKDLYEKSAEFRDRCHAYAGISFIPEIPEIL